ncbi:hypothetical protein NDA11_001099 [Ustilago hordei]|nr:hypothetical protein NDA10_003273 [Ustilago hordei]KAJ1586490.1 hypothetical protein NDA11_001099 [Ustilago hordei]KAJ1603440.1 hypothetical protein NDA14_006666 [Ustilago hordei]UTT94504.1 hypothetical protein NDA17_003606 [Ustilago hordei]
MVGYNNEHKGWKFYTPDHMLSIQWSNSATFHEAKGWHDWPKVQSLLQIRFESLEAEGARPEADNLEPELETEELDTQDSFPSTPTVQPIDATKDNQLEIAVEDMIGEANTAILNLALMLKEALAMQ